MEVYATKTAAKKVSAIADRIPRPAADKKAPASQPLGYDAGAKYLTAVRYCLAKNANATAPGPTCVPMVPPTVE